MATLIDLRRRIRSVRSSQQVTQAMKTVSTAKFRKALRTLHEGQPFWHAFPALVERLAFWAPDDAHPLLQKRLERKVEVVVVTADKGLAGAFNSNLLARAQAFIEGKAAGADVRLVLMGRKAAVHFKKQAWPADMVFAERTDRLGREKVRGLAEFLMKQYAFGRTDAVYIVYNEFKSILAPVVTAARILPLEPDPGKRESALWQAGFEPGAAELARFVLPLFFESQIHHVLHESQAAEHAARMMAMDNATKNAQELIDDLILVLNKIRQAGITKELLEIMTAVEALSKSPG